MSQAYRGILERLEVANFKSHKATDVTFTPGVNVIIGETDKGKSALMSAIRWAATGKPRGDSVKSWWGGKTSVQLTFSDGDEVSKARSGSSTSFKVADRTFKSTEGSNPPEVDAAIGLPEELCIQRQLDPVYMLSKTGGQASATVNAIVDMEVVTGSMSEALRASRNAKAHCESLASDLVMWNETVALYDWVADAEQRFEELTERHDALSALRRKREGLAAAIETIIARKAALAALPVPPDTRALSRLVRTYGEQKAAHGALQAKVSLAMAVTLEAKRLLPVKAAKDEAAQVGQTTLRKLQQQTDKVTKLGGLIHRCASLGASYKRAKLDPTLIEGVKALGEKRQTLLALSAKVKDVTRLAEAVKTMERLYNAAVAAEQIAKTNMKNATVVNGLCILCKQPVRSA